MSIFVYTFHKSGSMFLHRYFKELAELAGMAHFSVNNAPPNQDGWRDAVGKFVLCPIRLGAGGKEGRPSGQSVIHLRDPIDVLISQYFSIGWTHVERPGVEFLGRRRAAREMTIDSYCLGACEALAAKYRTLMADYDDFPNKVLSDYATMHDRFRPWNRYLCRTLLETDASAAERSLLAAFGREFGLMRRLFGRPVPPQRIMSGKASPHRRDGSNNQKTRYLRPETVRILERDMHDVLSFFAEFQAASRKELRADR